jgi:hypothetical protein
MGMQRGIRSQAVIAVLICLACSLSSTADEHESDSALSSFFAPEPTRWHGRSAPVAASIFGRASFVAKSFVEPSVDPEELLSATRFDGDLLDFGEIERSAGRSSGLFTILGVGIFAASVSDLASTEMGLSRFGVVETNPLQRARMVRIGSHVAVPAFVWWTSERLHAKGKTKLALFMRIGFTIAYGYATLHNTRALNVEP